MDMGGNLVKAKLIEIEEDLFADSQANLVHCVSRDFKMGAGIAVKFRDQFGNVKALRGQKPPVGGLAVLHLKDLPAPRRIFYLVTKEKYFNKPTYKTFSDSILALKRYCVKHEITSLRMPRIGCGLDKLHWNLIRSLIQKVFVDSGIIAR